MKNDKKQPLYTFDCFKVDSLSVFISVSLHKKLPFCRKPNYIFLVVMLDVLVYVLTR